MKRILLIIFLLAAQCSFVFAQDPFIKNFNTTNGLFSEAVFHTYQDSHGFLWFSSRDGAIRYDGNNFKLYNKKDGLDDNVVLRIKEDSSGRIWFFNYNGSVNFIKNNIIHNASNTPFLDLINNGVNYC